MCTCSATVVFFRLVGATVRRGRSENVGPLHVSKS